MQKRPFLFICVFLLLAGTGVAADEQRVELKTATGTISGLLRTPDDASSYPAALIIAGSGPTDGDGNTPMVAGKNDSLKMLAAALSDAGIASLRYDKRGVGKSAAAGVSEADLRFEHYVDDAAAWVELLSKMPQVQGVAIVGHSEGSLIGMLAARKSSATAFVSIAGAGDAASAILRRQLTGRLTPGLTSINEKILTALDAGKLWPDVPPQLNAIYRPSVQPYLISWFRYTPSVEIGKLNIPVLIVQGDTDIQVSPSDAQTLRKGCEKCSLQIVSGMNHIMKSVPADNARQMASYGDPALPLAPDLVKSIVPFLLDAGKRAR